MSNKRIAYLAGEIIKESSKLSKNSKRYGLFPIQNEESFEFMKKLEIIDWTDDEISYNDDITDYTIKADDAQRKTIDRALAFSSGLDGIVIENLALRLILESSSLEDRCFFVRQLTNELVHSLTYNKFILAFKPIPEERSKIFEAIDTLPSLVKLTEWLEKYMASDLPFYCRMTAYVALEGIIFTAGIFCPIFYFRTKSMFKELIRANSMIIRDEGIHARFGISKILESLTLVSDLKEAKENIKNIFKSGVSLAMDIADDMLEGGGSEELVPEKLKKYVEYVADFWLEQIGIDSIYGSENPYSWMESFGLQEKSNFFETTPSYNLASIRHALDWQKQVGWKKEETKFIESDF